MSSKLRRPVKLLILVALAVSAALWSATVIDAQTQSIYSPVILGTDTSTARQFQIKEDGSAFQTLTNCPSRCGDLSHNGVAGKRYFITSELPSSGAPADLVVYSESGSRIVLTSDKAYYPERVYWSLDGNRIAYTGKLCYAIGTDGQCQFKQGLIVGEVVRDTLGVPSAIQNERLVVEITKTYESQCNGTSACTYEYLSGFTWAPDNRRLAYVVERNSTGQPTEFFFNIVYAPPYPELPAITPLAFSDGNQTNRNSVSFSPITKLDGQGNALFNLAFSRLTDARGSVRFDIWTVSIPASYDGTAALVPRRITTSTNARNTYQLVGIDWSPDEQWLAYSGYTNSLYAVLNLYKIRSDGSGKSITLTNSTKSSLVLSGWRK